MALARIWRGGHQGLAGIWRNRRAAFEGHRGADILRMEICGAGAACGEDGDRMTPEVWPIACAPHFLDEHIRRAKHKHRHRLK